MVTLQLSWVCYSRISFLLRQLRTFSTAMNYNKITNNQRAYVSHNNQSFCTLYRHSQDHINKICCIFATDLKFMQSILPHSYVQMVLLLHHHYYDFTAHISSIEQTKQLRCTIGNMRHQAITITHIWLEFKESRHYCWCSFFFHSSPDCQIVNRQPE